MNLRLGFQGLLGLIVLGFAGSGLAQSEQWLQYRTLREPQGYRWLDLTNAPPAGVVWPKLGAKAHYGKWKNALDSKGERWICVDRAAKSGPCDRLYIDRNGNGRLDDETPLKATRRDEYMAYFDAAKVVFKGEDGPASYHLICRFYQYETNRAQLLTGSGCVYEGKVNLGGKKRSLQLVDATVNGKFNDISETSFDSDRIVIDGQEGESRFLGRLLEVDDQIYQVEVAPDGAFVKVPPAANLVLGKVQVPESITQLTAVGPNGQFVRKPVKDELTIPAGKYAVYTWSIDRKDSSGASWQLMGYGYSSSPKLFETMKDKPVALDIGEPIKTFLQASQNKSEFSFSLRMQGTLGESIQIMRGGEQAPPPRLKLTHAEGKPLTVSSFQYG